jgi:LPXTG-site transpeptidase (sortase) family protein
VRIIENKPLLLVLLIFLIGTVGTESYFLLLPEHKTSNPINKVPDKFFGWKFPIAKFPSTGSNRDLIAYSDIRDPGGIPQGLPVRLKIPSIGVDSAIEDALITSDGRMDVPAGTVNVAWFALGPHPGDVGSAVIGGHYGNYESNKGPTVFYYLDQLKAGDKVYIEDDTGNTRAFVVRRVQLFDRNGDPTTVFTSQDGLAHLNLITCEGIWNQVNDSYPDRRVVFTDAIPSEGEIIVKPKLSTRAKITPSVTPSSDNPILSPGLTPLGENITPNSVKSLYATPQVLIASAKSLYATPLDGLITFFLLISIVFMALKIIRR